jgi:hypothetical protein
VIDKFGVVIIPLEFDYISIDEGAIAAKKAYEAYLFDENGKAFVQVPFEYDQGATYGTSFSDGLTPVCKNDKWGYVNKSGEIVIPLEYDVARPFSDGLAAVVRGSNWYNWGAIDTSGNVVIPFEYEFVGDFLEGLMAAKKDDKFGFIDQTGAVIMPYEYDSAVWPFHDGLARVSYGIDMDDDDSIPLRWA